MKLKCLKCDVVKEVTGTEFEQKAAMFNGFMHGAADYLNLFSLTGGECSIVDEKLGDKHIFEFEEGTDKQISTLLGAYTANKKTCVDKANEVKLHEAKVNELEEKLVATRKLIHEGNNAFLQSQRNADDAAKDFTKVTGIENIDKWN